MSKELEKIYKEIEQIVLDEKELFSRAIDMCLQSGVTSFPIIIFGPEQLNMEGEILQTEGSLGTWKICLSTLEKFSEVGLIREDRLVDFKMNYKNPEEFYCLFVVKNNGATFAFLPR
jgi:hypothetical protein